MHNPEHKESGAFDYQALDAFKNECLEAAGVTDTNALSHSCRVVSWSRGGSCFLYEEPDRFTAHVHEGVGTKGVVAMADEIGEGFWSIGLTGVASVANDMVVTGALPYSLAMCLMVGDDTFLTNQKKRRRLIAGWRKGCEEAGAVWGPGETQRLEGPVSPGHTIISGSAMGKIMPKARVIRPHIQQGDRIVLLYSRGLQDNGYTPARNIGERLPKRYRTKMYAGDEYGMALLQPSLIYVPVMRACLEAGIPIHYAAHITGHGWRKLMRAPGSFAYVIEYLPPPQTVFQFIKEMGGYTSKQMFGTFNMGAGFALYVPWNMAERVVALADGLEFGAMIAGYIEHAKEKRVIIAPEGIEFDASTLEIH